MSIVTQNGKIVTVNGSILTYEGGGFEYETGTYTPATDTASPSISFSNTHTNRPILVMIMAENKTYDASYANTVMRWQLLSSYDYYGYSINYAHAEFRYFIRASGAYAHYTTTITDLTNTTYGMPRWLTNSGFSPYCSDSYFYRAGLNYTWVAVWAS